MLIPKECQIKRQTDLQTCVRAAQFCRSFLLYIVDSTRNVTQLIFTSTTDFIIQQPAASFTRPVNFYKVKKVFCDYNENVFRGIVD